MVGDMLLVPGLNIRDVLIARALADQDSSDSESDAGSDLDSLDGLDFDPFDEVEPITAKRSREASPSLLGTPCSAPRTNSLKCPHLEQSPACTFPDDGNDEYEDAFDNVPAPAHQNPAARLDRVGAKKLKMKVAFRERRHRKRAADLVGHPTGQKAVCAARVHMATPLSLPNFTFLAHTLPVASTHWMGLRDSAIQNAANRDATPGAPAFEPPEDREYNLLEILDPALDMTLLEWDGVPAPVVDGERTVFALLGAGPRDPLWKTNVADAAATAIEDAALKIFGEDVFYGEFHGTRKHTKKKKNGQQSTPASQKAPR
ncbi:hypothetical protein FB451DRAFT_1392217 [Mycena latifolia]|nr:hypothetical protein FB451DRAFT_1392217 [Mycena latifolia]